MASRKLTNQMQDTTRNNLNQSEFTDSPNNEKATSHQASKQDSIDQVCNDLDNPPHTQSQDLNISSASSQNTKRCDAEDKTCEGEIRTYSHRHFNCLSALQSDPPNIHNFCRHHYDNATSCPVHPTFSKIS
ncbi:uncharacterized protein [Dysidea avara]|uniref:uncharacterized protein n=1 Tax=Dysidea avara TaxID=196820 RepID=UPI00332E57D7